MSRQTIAVIVGAIVLFAAAIGGTLAFTGGSDANGNGNVHTMENGQVMTGEMTTTTSDGTHTMTNGETMTGEMEDMP